MLVSTASAHPAPFSDTQVGDRRGESGRGRYRSQTEATHKTNKAAVELRGTLFLGATAVSIKIDSYTIMGG